MSMIFYSQNYHSCFLLVNNSLFSESLFNNHIYRTFFIRSCLLMKQIYLTHELTIEAQPVLFSYPDFNTPKWILPTMQVVLTPVSEIFITVSNLYESNLFMVEHTLVVTIRSHPVADGYIIDHVFTRDYHDVDTVLLETLSNGIKNK